MKRWTPLSFIPSCISQSLRYWRRSAQAQEADNYCDTLTMVIAKTVNDKIYFRLLDASDRILMTSRNYSSHEDCLNEIYYLQRYGDFHFSIAFEADSGQMYFEMKGKHGRKIAHSGSYVLRGRLQSDLEKVRTGISKAYFVDTSSRVKFFRNVKV